MAGAPSGDMELERIVPQGAPSCGASPLCAPVSPRTSSAGTSAIRCAMRTCFSIVRPRLVRDGAVPGHAAEEPRPDQRAARGQRREVTGVVVPVERDAAV